MQKTGVFFSDARRDLLEDRIGELVAARGLPSLMDYYYLLKYDPDAAAAWKELTDRLAVPETYFWRQPDQFKALTEVILPRYLETGHASPLRIWSAACCTGEEPLSIAMALEAAGWFDRLPIEIAASDASPAMVERARAGLYPERSMRNLPAGWRERFFHAEGGAWRIDPALHRRVRWALANLVDETETAPLATAEVIFCRNVFIYFSDDAIRRVTRVFAQRMPQHSYLFISAAESLMRITSDFAMDEVGGAFVYLKSGSSGSRPPARGIKRAFAPPSNNS